MRKRFNRNAVASSCNYTASRMAHLAMLKENHEKNSYLFMMVMSEPAKERTGNELFLEKLKDSYREYKRKKIAEELEFKAKFKAFLNH